MQIHSLPRRSSKCGVRLTLAEQEHQEMNVQVEVTWRNLRTVAHSLMVHTTVPEVYVHLTLMYTTDHIFLILPIKDIINEDGDPTMPHKLATGTKPCEDPREVAKQPQRTEPGKSSRDWKRAVSHFADGSGCV